METIAQLQSKLQEAADLLASVTRELDAHRNAGAAAESFDFARLRCDAENHPYTGHPVTRSSMPELYYLLLLTILTSAEAKEAQWLHLYRIAKGADYAQDVHDLLPAAHAMTDVRMVECIECIRRDNLTRAFLLDAMILTLLREEEDTSLLEYIAGLAALMEVPPAEITEVIQLAKCVASQDSERYFDLIAKTPALKQETDFYFPQISNDLDRAPHSDTKHLILTCISKKDAHINLDEWKATRISFVLCNFNNVTFESKHKHIDFFDCIFEKAYNKSCLFINKGTMKDCRFKNCKTDKQVPIIHLSHFEIISTEFINCFSESTHTQSLFLVKNTIISNCTFSGCKTQYESQYGTPPISIIQATQTSLIQNCTFHACHVHGRFWSPLLDTRGKHALVLLDKSTQKDNRFIECTGREIQELSEQ